MSLPSLPTDAERAQQITGCVVNTTFVEGLKEQDRIPFCEAHDEDGNPDWQRCRWAKVYEAFFEMRKAEADRLLALENRLRAIHPFEHGGLFFVDRAAVLGTVASDVLASRWRGA